jgi:hypothetical protein
MRARLLPAVKREAGLVSRLPIAAIGSMQADALADERQDDDE